MRSWPVRGPQPRVRTQLRSIIGWLNSDAKILAKTLPEVVMGRGGLVVFTFTFSPIQNGTYDRHFASNGGNSSAGKTDLLDQAPLGPAVAGVASIVIGETDSAAMGAANADS